MSDLSFESAKEMSSQELELNCYKALYKIYKRALNKAVLHSKGTINDMEDKSRDDIVMSLVMSEMDRDKVRFINELLNKP